MEVFVNEINGLADCICTLYLSKRNIDREKELHIRNVCKEMIDRSGKVIPVPSNTSEQFHDMSIKFKKYLMSVSKYGRQHTTLLRYMDFSCSIYGLHRGAQDDFDSHAIRLNNRIVRSSTRLAKFKHGEKSDRDRS